MIEHEDSLKKTSKELEAKFKRASRVLEENFKRTSIEFQESICHACVMVFPCPTPIFKIDLSETKCKRKLPFKLSYLK